MKKKKNIEKERIDKLENCIRDKDKRIKKLEDYFWLRNRLILSTIITILCALPLILVSMYIPPLNDVSYEVVSFLHRLLMVIGMIVSCFVIPIGSWIWLMIKIWEEG